VFDVNETLLDMSALDTHFKDLFGNKDIRTMWFGQVVQSALVATVTDSYAPFNEVSAAALEMTAARLRIRLSAAGRNSILEAMRTLPAHPEVAGSLTLLGRSGIRLAALTNSTEEVAVAQLENAGIAQYFSRILSADSVRRLKPSAAPYQLAANELGVGIAHVRMVAAHAWDIAGALRSGCTAAFVARPGMVLDPLVETPDIVGSDLNDVARQIIAIEVSQTGQ
jgi:2-haloacid dehalogenase